MVEKPPSKQKGNETVGTMGGRKDAGVEAGGGTENITGKASKAATDTGNGELKLVNRLAESKSPYVSISCTLLSFLYLHFSFSFAWTILQRLSLHRGAIHGKLTWKGDMNFLDTAVVFFHSIRIARLRFPFYVVHET